MEALFKVHKASRERILDLVEKYSSEQLQTIPTGFANNLLWNAAHVVVTQHLLTYNLCGLEIPLDKGLVDRYRKGTAPNGIVEQAEIDQVKELLISTHHSYKKDFELGKFSNFKEYQTSYGVLLTSIEEAMTFNNTHEGMHLGYMLAMRKSL